MVAAGRRRSGSTGCNRPAAMASTASHDDLIAIPAPSSTHARASSPSLGGERHARRPRPRDRAPDFLLHRADNNIVVNGKVADTGGHAAPLEIGRRGAEHAQIVRQPLHLQDRDRAADRNKWLCRAGFDDVRRLFDGFEMDRDVGVEHPIMAEQRRKAGAPDIDGQRWRASCSWRFCRSTTIWWIPSPTASGR